MQQQVFVLLVVMLWSFCSCRPVYIDHPPDLQQVADGDKDLIMKTSAVEADITTTNHSGNAAATENQYLRENVDQKIKLWQWILVFGGLLLLSALAAVIAYIHLFETPGADKKADEGEKAKEVEHGPDAGHKLYFEELAQQKMDKGEEIKGRYIFFLVTRH
jgi:hypothetical protein